MISPELGCLLDLPGFFILPVVNLMDNTTITQLARKLKELVNLYHKENFLHFLIHLYIYLSAFQLKWILTHHQQSIKQHLIYKLRYCCDVASIKNKKRPRINRTVNKSINGKNI